MKLHMIHQLAPASLLSSGTRRSRFAFTLIEVLLTTVLAATLLAALWSLLSMYSKMFETGHARTEQSQLARALMRQISDDLHSVILTPPKVQRVPVIASASPTTPAPAATTPGKDNTKSPSAPDRAERGRRFPVSKGPSLASAQGNVGTATNGPANSVGSGPPSMNRGLNRQAATPPAANAAPPNPSQPGSQQPGNSPSSDPKTVHTTSSLRPAGLFGTDSYVQIDVYQPTDPPPESDFGDPTGLGAIAPTRAPELRTIIYSFEETGEPGQHAGEPQMCLTRRELDWEQAHPAGEGSQSGERPEVRTAQEPATPFGASTDPSLGLPGSSSGLTGSAPGLPGAAPGLQSPDNLLGGRLPGDQPTEGQTSDAIPEVMHFGLRYFDGAMWTESWDSVARQGLPVAIEVRLELKHPHDTLAAAQASATPTTPGAPTHDLTLTKRRLPSYRLVVHLPPATEVKPMARDPYSPGRSSPGESPRMDRGASPLRGDSHAGLR